MKKLMSLIACVTALAFITPVFAQDEGEAPAKAKKVKKVKKVKKEDGDKAIKKVKKVKKEEAE